MLPNKYFTLRDQRLNFYIKKAKRKGVKLAPRHIKRLNEEIPFVVAKKLGIKLDLNFIFSIVYQEHIEKFIPIKSYISENAHHSTIAIPFDGVSNEDS